MERIKKYYNLFRDVFSEWKWIFVYIKKYKLYIFIYILMNIVGTAMSLGSSVSVKYLIDAVVSRLDSVIFKYAAGVIGLAVLNIILRSISSWIAAQIGTKTNNEIRAEVYKHMISANWQDINKYHSGDLINRIEGDVSTVSNGVINFIPSFITNLLQFLGSLAIVLYYDKTMAVLSLMSAPLLVLSSSYLIKKIRAYNLEGRKINGDVLAYSSESMQNIQVIKSFDLTKRYIENFAKLLDNFREVRLKYQKFSILISLVLSLIGLVVSYSCYGWGVYRLWKGAITYGTMTLFLQLSGRLTSSFGALASMASQAVSIATSAGRVMEITAFEKELDADKEKALEIMEASQSNGVSVYADNLGFRYSDGDFDVLNNASFYANPGETIALVGPSGEGKSTMLKLLLGIMKPTNGRLYLKNGDKEIDVSDSTRRFYSYVPQEFGIFTGTIAENLQLAKADATEEEMIEALKSADIYDFVQTLPEGIYSKITENAANISKGQAQRIIIARALLKNSQIMLMDEATSALDLETEKIVLENIMKTDKNKVCIITTHRESMLKYCDRVYRINSDGSMYLDN